MSWDEHQWGFVEAPSGGYSATEKKKNTTDKCSDDEDFSGDKDPFMMKDEADESLECPEARWRESWQQGLRDGFEECMSLVDEVSPSHCSFEQEHCLLALACSSSYYDCTVKAQLHEEVEFVLLRRLLMRQVLLHGSPALADDRSFAGMILVSFLMRFGGSTTNAAEFLSARNGTYFSRFAVEFLTCAINLGYRRLGPTGNRFWEYCHHKKSRDLLVEMDDNFEANRATLTPILAQITPLPTEIVTTVLLPFIDCCQML